jgi:hypothetical protein
MNNYVYKAAARNILSFFTVQFLSFKGECYISPYTLCREIKFYFISSSVLNVKCCGSILRAKTTYLKIIGFLHEAGSCLLDERITPAFVDKLNFT